MSGGPDAAQLEAQLEVLESLRGSVSDLARAIERVSRDLRSGMSETETVAKLREALRDREAGAYALFVAAAARGLASADDAVIEREALRLLDIWKRRCMP